MTRQVCYTRASTLDENRGRNLLDRFPPRIPRNFLTVPLRQLLM